jgi:hypothetical protein
MTRIPVPRVVPADLGTLERRAQELAAPAEVASDRSEEEVLRLVSFRLRRMPCAVEAAAVERAIVLGRPLAVPSADGSERHVAFVLERPLRVIDLAAAVTGTARSGAELEGAPALVVRTASALVAVAVEGPLDLAEDRVAAHTDRAGELDAVRTVGRLCGGALLLDASWLATWAGKVGP